MRNTNTASAISTCRPRSIGSGRRSMPPRPQQARRGETEDMTRTADLALPSARATENKLIGSVCFAHFVSHYYIMLLAPLFVFVREDYGVSYTELGFALTAFNVTTTVLQTPMGFLVDRVSARVVLITGL